MIIDLPIPQTRDELSLHRVGSWDDEKSPSNTNSSNAVVKVPSLSHEPHESSFCPHAVSFGSFVHGVRSSNSELLGDNGEDDAEGLWISWKTSFAPYQVCRVTSNLDGSIVVCSTDAGTVALLRGIDGAVIATRKVTSEEGNNIVASPQISFVARCASSKKTNDAVAIGVPSSSSEFLLVSKIDAKSLNHNNPLKASDAARNMTIRTSLKFQNNSAVVVAMCGLFLDETRIRFLTLDKQEDLAVHDYDCSNPEKALVVVQDSFSWRDTDSKGSSIDIGTGLRLHQLNEDAKYVMFSAFGAAGGSTIHFLDPTRLSMAGSLQISPSSSTKNRKRMKILAVEPVTCAMPESALAVAVAFKPHQDSTGGAMIHVLQARINQGNLESFHRVYAVPISNNNEPVNSLSLAMFAPKDVGYYSFRYKIYLGNENYACKVFVAGENNHDGSTIGKIRLLVRFGRFDEADQLVVYGAGEGRLIADECADFHPSEVALGRLQQILKRGSISEQDLMAQAKQCLHRLSSGCISGNERAGLNLLEAAESIAQWASFSESPQSSPSLMEVTAALASLAKALDEVVNFLPSNKLQKFEVKRNELQDQLATLKYLTSLAPKDPAEKADFTRRFQGSRTPGQLFSNLIASEYFSAAERMWNSHLRVDIRPEMAVESIIRLGPNVDPHGYVALLEGLVMPSLTISYELLPSLWVWSCKLADELDDKDHLQHAIQLLQSIERGTNELQLRVHTSFASFCPFVDRPVPRKVKAIGSKNSSHGDLSFSSYGSLPSSPQQQQPVNLSTRTTDESVTAFPTVLQMGHIKRGAIKSRPVSSSVQNIKHATGGDDVEDAKEGRVREKLLHATCLEAARELGLDKQAASLRSFSSFGGMQNFAKELVRALSTSAKNHDDRCSIFTHKFKPFCEAFSVDFEESLLQYLKGLCRSTNTTAPSIQESASVARCCDSISTKCQGILVVLRAALFCKYSPPWLTDLSRDAVEWSSVDLGLRSELVEASRLLLIDGIVRKYCGNEGCDLFRVDNPRHAVRLLEFITQHFRRDAVLTDALDLADAFNHLSRLDACTALCCQAISGGHVENCSSLVESIYERDLVLGDSTCDQVVSFCIELVSENSNGMHLTLPTSRLAKLKENALCASAAACAVISIAFAQSRAIATMSATINHYSKIDVPHLEALKFDFLRINELQRIHSVFLSLSDLRCTATLLKVAASLMEPVVTAYVSGDQNEWNVKLSKAKRACSLLAGACECPEMEFWCAAVSIVSSPLKWEYDDERCIDFLDDVGVLGGFRASDPIASRVILSVAFCLCFKASNQARAKQAGFNENFGRAVSLVHDYCLASCPEHLLLQAQSLSVLAETVWHVLLRGDEGVGERLEVFRRKLLIQSWSSRDGVESFKHGTPEQSPQLLPSLCRSPTLHPTWYIGDGLLLPPSESMSRSVKFCKDIMSTLALSTRKFVPLASGGINEMIRFLIHRGALSVGLRLLSCSSAIIMCSGVPDSAFEALAGSVQDVFAASVERSLGGTGNGITSNIVDSQHAVSFLLSLRVKLAFKVYKSAVPTALSTRDYTRVIALANIGVVAGSGNTESLADDKHVVVGWKNQDKLVAQCKRLSNQAVWWRFLRKHRVSFDQKLFDDDKNPDTAGSRYAQSLVIPIITKLLTMLGKKRNGPVHGVLGVLTRYADTFGLQHGDIVEAYIGYMLSSSSDDNTRVHLLDVEQSVRALIPLLKPNLRQAIVLRRCVVALERNEALYADYEHHALVLSLYLESLHNLKVAQSQIQRLDLQIFEAELEAIDRRCDALAILSSVFEEEKKCDRPPFPSFFRPLPLDLSQYSTDPSTVASCGILGNANTDAEKSFDPLEALQGVLLRSYDVNTSTALAPLCLPLGLPSGYIHARFLMEHFQWSKKQNSTLPSFQQDVLPVFSRIQSSGDKAALAEWCFAYYVSNDEDRLKCLELALRCAIKHSSEAEQRKNRLSRNTKDAEALGALAQEEMKALESVQRLSKSKSALSDKITVVSALSQGPAVSSTTQQLLAKLQRSLWNSQDNLPLPEVVTEVLLTEASLIAANESVGGGPLSMQQFRQFSSTVNNACQGLSEQHSHIRIGQITRTMVRSWLFQGDGINGYMEKSMQPRTSALVTSKPSKKMILPAEFKEEDTINFVMDLSTIQDDDQVWSEDSAAFSNPAGSNITSDEERSALRKSEREESEEMTVRVALRVAFVLSCHDTDKQSVPGMANTPSDNENSSAMANSRSSSRSTGKGKGGGLLARIEKVGAKQNAYVMECARDLLQVVFAKPDLHCQSRFVSEHDRNLSKNVTFSMRHRALRSAAVLVPQEALEKVIEEENYLDGEASQGCSLSKCTFGAFVANECEQIGMPLTHSDLGHISSMHYSSYARTLWRHHRDGDLKGSRGRLLLLLLEMSLKGEAEIDTAFVELILKEMGRLLLSRTLLLACEGLLSFKEEIGSKKYDSLLSACDGEVHTAIMTSAKAILGEIQEKAESDSVIRRLGHIVQSFSDNPEGQTQLHWFVAALTNTAAKMAGNETFTKEVLLNALHHISNREVQEKLFSEMQKIPGLV